MAELKPLPTMSMAPSEYHVWHKERTPEHVRAIHDQTMGASTRIKLEFDANVARAGGETFERTTAYSHWRGRVGDVYSDDQRHDQRRIQAQSKTDSRKVGAHATGPGIGYHSKFYYRR